MVDKIDSVHGYLLLVLVGDAGKVLEVLSPLIEFDEISGVDSSITEQATCSRG